jgi:transposase InsO family protein
VQSVGGTPFKNLILDFTEMPCARGCKYLLVLLCTFSRWVEAFPTLTEKAQEVAGCLLKEITPPYGIPMSIESDNRPAFVTEVVHLVAKGLRITWKLHRAYQPQHSGKVQHISRTLKLQLKNYARRPTYNGISYCP